MDEIINSAKGIGQFMAVVIVSLFFCKQYLNQYFKKTNVGKMLPRQNKLDLEILNKLEYVKEILNADRIHVYEFHNGEHYSDYRLYNILQPDFNLEAQFPAVAQPGIDPVFERIVGVV